MMHTQPDQIIGELQSAVQNGLLPTRHRAHGTAVLAHLTAPVRVAVLGRPNGGKTCVVNMLLGGNYIRLPQGLEFIEVIYGPAAQVTLNWPDGEAQRYEMAAAKPDGAQHAMIELPLEALKTTAYCEVSLPAEPVRQQDVLQNLRAFGQVFLWCSEAFDTEEQALWQSVPDEIKDHSFLVMTKADRQIMKGELAERRAALELAAADAFLGLHPVATLHALKAQADADQSALWDASGGRGLAEAVQAQVRRGRAADLDQAEVLLAQLGKGVQAGGRATETPALAVQTAVTPNTDETTLMGRLQDQLQTAAQEMLADLDTGKIPNADGLLSRCSATLRALTQTLTQEAAQDAEAAEMLADAQDGEETLMLLQVEQSPTAAADAVVVLLQLKKEMGARATA